MFNLQNVDWSQFTTRALIAVYGVGIGWGKFKAWRSERRNGNPKIFQEATKIDAMIERALTELRVRVRPEASRVLVFRFGNGERYYSGAPRQKIFCEYESPDSRSRPVQSEFGVMEVGRMAGIIGRMFPDSEFVTSVEKMPEGYAKTWSMNLGVTHFAAVPLMLYAQIEGCLLIQWTVDDVEADSLLSVKVAPTVKEIEQLWSRRLHQTGKHP